jgi:succinoglycan biosynthesis protein ExoA
MSVRPRVSVIIPARNEAATIAACVRSVLAQGVAGGIEVVVADGRSTDDTARLARSEGAIVVDNPRRITPAGLNAALAVAQGDVIVRFDGHAEMPAGYVNACLRALAEEPGAVGVGGWFNIEGRGAWGRATAAALASRFGVGNPRLRRRPRPGEGRIDVDTFMLGCWPATALRAQGGWDERFVRNQDFELNYRLRRAGGRIVFDPAIWSIYRPRETLQDIGRQYCDYGRFKALTVVTAPESIRPRHLAPVALFALALAAVVPTRLTRAARAGLALYYALLAAVTVRSGGGWRTFPVLVTIHAAWGAGLLAGLARNVVHPRRDDFPGRCAAGRGTGSGYAIVGNTRTR